MLIPRITYLKYEGYLRLILNYLTYLYFLFLNSLSIWLESLQCDLSDAAAINIIFRLTMSIPSLSDDYLIAK